MALSPELRDLRMALDVGAFAEAIGFSPDPWQAGVLHSRSKRILLNCSRQAGKSTVASLLSSHRAVYRPHSTILLSSPSLRQSGELFRKVQDVMHRVKGAPKALEDNKLSLALENGSRIVSLPGAEATVRGFSSVDLLIEDEASRVPDALYRATRPMLAVSGGSLILMSTPFGKRGHFFEEWIGKAGWERYEVPATMCPRISKEFLEEERAAVGSWWFAQEYECVFGDTIDSLFTHADIMAAMKGDIPDLFGPDDAAVASRAAISDIPAIGGLIDG